MGRGDGNQLRDIEVEPGPLKVQASPSEFRA